MATYIVIHVDNMTPITDTTVAIEYRWMSISGTTGTSGSGEATFGTSLLSSVLNQNVIDVCVAESAAAGITIGALDRKIVSSGII